MNNKDIIYKDLVWDDVKTLKFWHWQSQFKEAYFTNIFGKRIVWHLRHWLIGKGCSVLDYGCGPGFLIPHLVKNGQEVWAADFSDEAVRLVNERYGSLPNFNGALTVDQCRVENRKFSRIVSIEVIEHLSDAHLTAFFDTLKQLLAQKGLVVVTTPNSENLRDLETYCPCCDHVFHRFQHVRTFTPDTLAATVRDNGFVPLKIFTTDFSRHPFWHPRQWGKDVLALIVGAPKRTPHLVCIATLP